MKFLLKFTAILLSFAILAGCRQKPLEEVPEIEPSEEIISAEENLFPEDEAKKLLEIARIYEISNKGTNLDENEAVYPSDSTAFAWLSVNSFKKAYKEEDGSTYYVPGKVLKSINEFLFANIKPEDSEDFGETNFGFGGEWDYLPFSLSPKEIEYTDEGKISATFLREMDEVVLNPVTFVFVPETAGEIPKELSVIYKSGDTVYKIESVTQRPELIPKPEPQTIEISNAEELLAAAKRINEGKFENQWDNYVLTADIDLSGVDWIPIGINAPVIDFWGDNLCDPNLRGFNGTFDGQGYTISNFTITEEQNYALREITIPGHPDRNIEGAGFFYCIGEEGTVKNLHFKNANIDLPIVYWDNGIGSDAGILAVTCSGVVDSVNVQGKISGSAEIGGMISYLGGTNGGRACAINCLSDVEVTGNGYIGGMIGTLHYASIENCTSKGIVNAVQYDDNAHITPSIFGGMVGHIVEGHAANCHAACYVLTKVPSSLVGGFCGLAEGGSITSCTVNKNKAGNWEAIDDIHRIENPDIVIE